MTIVLISYDLVPGRNLTFVGVYVRQTMTRRIMKYRYGGFLK